MQSLNSNRLFRRQSGFFRSRTSFFISLLLILSQAGAFFLLR